MSRFALVKRDQWQDDVARYVVLVDKETNGQSYAECIIVPLPGASIASMPEDWRAQIVQRIIERTPPACP